MTQIANVSPPDVPVKKPRKPRKNSNAQSNAEAPQTPPSGSTDPAVTVGSPLEKFASNLKADYDGYSVWQAAEPFRTRLGMAEVGSDCVRALWYGFRWFTPFVASPSLSRAFQRGRAEEAAVFARLQGIGFQVYTTGPDGAQITVSDFGGHYGGRCDAVAIAHQRYGMGDKPFLVSVKTSATGRAFTKFDQPMFQANFKYYTQECNYGFYLGIDRAITVISEKNTDDVTIKAEALDMNHAKAMKERAYSVIMAIEAPNRISDNPENPTCKYCPHSTVCHDINATAAVNCRSCRHSRPVFDQVNDTGRPGWICMQFQDRGVIPQNVIETGCDNWHQID